ncbi:immunoglobulin-like domain-containing protein [Paenibacillus sp. UNC496MF]|uniref:immunoglobulin-like domain-containing protein n=1 Tax=Paenibacillus sp. UNC496MF TaxID=1502753 RepID=UPI001C42EE0F|nr:immunoglobulin-like domain-containing protein [Paenibacillus sp. UNC496MF]
MCKNNSGKLLSFGTDFTIQKLKKNEWNTIILNNFAIGDVGTELKPGTHSSDYPVILKYLPAGEYRVVKRIRLGTEAESPQIDLVSDAFTLK